MSKRKGSIIEHLEPAIVKVMNLNIKHPRLQSIAKKYHVKANLRKEEIIRRLLAKGLTF